MEKYENLGLVGEGSYGMVMKCRHKETGQLVAIKKFLESEDDRLVKKIAMREIRLLKQLRHANLVNLLEVFRRKKRLYLVFEFVDHTVLDDLEKYPHGLDETTCKKILYQVLRGVEFCHMHNIVHRDVKPENILVSRKGVVKLCDFGFARTLAAAGEAYTDYVATRWYRAPELLVGDTKYGREVDIWAIGCLLAEMLTGEPLFPGDSDLDQLFHIVKCFGNLTQRYREIFLRNPLYVGMKVPEVRDVEPLEKRLSRVSRPAMDFMKHSMRLEANDRPTCSQLIKLEFFQRDNFASRYDDELHALIAKENESNPLLRSMGRATNGEEGGSRRGAGKAGKERKQVAAGAQSTSSYTGGGVGPSSTFHSNNREGKENQQKSMEVVVLDYECFIQEVVPEVGNQTSRSMPATEDVMVSDKPAKKKSFTGLNSDGTGVIGTKKPMTVTESYMPPIFQSQGAASNERQSQSTMEERMSPVHQLGTNTASPTFINGNTTPAGPSGFKLTTKRASGGVHQGPTETDFGPINTYVVPSALGGTTDHAANAKHRSSSLFLPKIVSSSSTSGGNCREQKLPAFHPSNKSSGTAAIPPKTKKGHSTVMPHITHPIEQLTQNSGQVHSSEDEHNLPNV